MAPETAIQAWLVRQSGSLEGRRTLLAGEVTRVGRDPHNDLPVDGEESVVVSSRHLEIRLEGDRHQLYDLASTNGVLLNGVPVESATLADGDVVRLGSSGPSFLYQTESLPTSDIDRTVVFKPDRAPPTRAEHPPVRAKPNPAPSSAGRLSAETAIRLRGMVERDRGLRTVIRALSTVVLVLGFALIWTVLELRRDKKDLDIQIATVETGLASSELTQEEERQLLERLDTLGQEAQRLRENPLFSLAGFGDEMIFVEAELRELLNEFGAEQYHLPPDFVERVNDYVEEYRNEERPIIARTLEESSESFDQMKAQFIAFRLPPELAYVAVAESGLRSGNTSSAGAVGVWQFRAPTARQYGLRIDDEVDERLDPVKASRAAAAYFRHLILDFGSGSSVLIAMAAYNVGPTRMKRTLRAVEDPIQQRNFWYLYRTRRLPAETREYVPKVLAAMIVGRNPDRYGF